MSCKNPYFSKKLGVAFSCGQCMPCRISRRRAWTCRAVLEMTQHTHNTFLTLTYNPENEPLNGSLEPKHLVNFWKRCRRSGYKFRYFACGEYGEKSFRPHYHAILFGVDPLRSAAMAEQHWTDPETKQPLGFVYAVPATIETAQYVAGYVSKKLCNDSRDYEDLGLHKEFIRLSRRPAIGAFAIEELLKRFKQFPQLDIFSTIKIGGKDFPMPKYLKRKLRELVFSEEYRNALSESFVLNMRDELEDLVRKHFGDGANYELRAREAYLMENRSKFLNLDAKEKIYNSRNKI